MKKMLMAAVAAASLCGFAKAEEIKIDFDGRKAPRDFADAFGSGSLHGDAPGVPAVSAPEQVKLSPEEAIKKEVRIRVSMKSAGGIKEEDLVCTPAEDGEKVTDCKKKSDSSDLSIGDINAMALRKYFPEKTLNFADLLSQTMHSYTNQSGPQTFSCDDECGNWEAEEVTVGWPPKIEVKMVCKSWTHSCECVSNCY